MQVPLGKHLGRQNSVYKKKTEWELNVHNSECRRALKGINKLVIASSGVIVVKVFPYFLMKAYFQRNLGVLERRKSAVNHGALCAQIYKLTGSCFHS